MSMQPMGNTPQQSPTKAYDRNSARERMSIRTGNAPDPWEANRYRRSKSGTYEIQNDPNRAINRQDTQNELEGAFDFDARQRSILDQTQVNEATTLQGEITSAWNRERDRQEEEYASLYAEAQRIGARPFKIKQNANPNNPNGGWAFEQLDTNSLGEIRTKIVNAAMSQVNRTDLQYSWGGGGTKGASYGINGGGALDARNVFGFDCSGLVQYAYARAGISLGRHSTHQTTAGRIVPINQLKPGDLVGWGRTPGSSTHVAVYLGNGMIAEAANTRDDLRVRKLSNSAFDKQIFGVQIIRGN